jgi:hypothetical protein
VQIFFILVHKAKIRRKICRKIHWFLADFPTDFSFKGLKANNLNIQGLICIKKKIQGLKPKNRELIGTKKMIKARLIIIIRSKFNNCDSKQ